MRRWLLVGLCIGVLCAASPKSAGAQDWRDLRFGIYNVDLPRVQRALSQGVDPDAGAGREEVYPGYTALHLAAAWGASAGIIEALLNAGADPEALTPRGESVTEIAQSQNNPGVGRMVQRWVERRNEQAAAQRAAAQAAAQRQERTLAIRELEARAAPQAEALLRELRDMRALLEQISSALQAAPQARATAPPPTRATPLEQLNARPAVQSLQECTIEQQWTTPNPELDGQIVPFCLAACAYMSPGGSEAAARDSCERLDLLVRQSGTTAGGLCRVCGRVCGRLGF